MKLKREDFTIEANKGGYMISYKNIKIGGAGTFSGGKNIRGAKAVMQQTKDYREMAGRDIDKIIQFPDSGTYSDLIKEIDNKQK